MIEWSIQEIISLRSLYATNITDLFFKIVSQFGDKAILGFTVFFTVHWIGKTEAFMVMTAFDLSVTALGTLKLYYAEPRPYFLSTDLHPASCKDLEYGYPSGHTTITACVYITLFYCMACLFLFSKKGNFCESLLTSLFWFIVLCFFLLFIGFSRLFLGVHSID